MTIDLEGFRNEAILHFNRVIWHCSRIRIKSKIFLVVVSRKKSTKEEICTCKHKIRRNKRACCYSYYFLANIFAYQSSYIFMKSHLQLLRANILQNLTKEDSHFIITSNINIHLINQPQHLTETHLSLVVAVIHFLKLR
jgi:hypothetical protein